MIDRLLQHRVASLSLTLLMVIVIRELCVWACRPFGLETAANIIAMLLMLVLLLLWRAYRGWHRGLPLWISDASNIWLKDSGFAFLSISAGAGILLFTLGNELIPVVVIMAISTIIPLWFFAKLAQRWLADE